MADGGAAGGIVSADKGHNNSPPKDIGRHEELKIELHPSSENRRISNKLRVSPNGLRVLPRMSIKEEETKPRMNIL